MSAREITQSEEFESLCGYMESLTILASTTVIPTPLLNLYKRIYGSVEQPDGSLKEFVLYGCSDWEVVPSWTTVNVKVSVVVDTLKTDLAVDNFVRMMEALNSAPPDSQLRVQSGSIAVDNLRLADDSNAIDDIMKNSSFLPQLLVCAIASSAGADELAVNVFCGGFASLLPRLQTTPQQERDMFMTNHAGLRVSRGVEYLRKHVKKLFGERAVVLYSCPTHPSIQIQHLFDLDAAAVPGEWMDNVQQHLSGHPFYSRLLNLQENCLREDSRCLFHLISFHPELHADAWRCFADYCIRQKGKAEEFAHIVIPAPSTRTMDIPSARPESFLAHPPSSDKWMELCEELTNYTGSGTRRSAIGCTYEGPLALSRVLEESDRCYLIQSILPHMTLDQGMSMIIELALHRMGMGDRAPSFPLNFLVVPPTH
eukprot:gene29940-36160_t